jgi:hypothetical protein
MYIIPIIVKIFRFARRRLQYITMSTLLAKNAEVWVTMDGQRGELKNAGIYVEGGLIKQIALNVELPATPDVVLDWLHHRL